MTRDRKEYMKGYHQAHKESEKAKMRAWRESHKEYYKAYRESHKECLKEYQNQYRKEYSKSDLNSLGHRKSCIRLKSQRILKRMNLHIPGYEIHHCFGYEDPSKFIYISKALHLKIHAYLREHNIDAGKDHWMHIRDIVNDTDEFVYIKA